MKDNIVEIFFDAAKMYHSKTAIVHKDQQISYGELATLVESKSIFLSKKGIREGDKILVFIPMSIELYATVLALFSLGAVVVFVDEWANKERLKKAIQVVDIDTIIAPRKLIWLAYILPGFRKIKRKFSIPKTIPQGQFKYRSIQKDSTALITFTTGSTGIPKAANRTHQFLWEQFRILKEEIGAKEEDHCLITLPIVLLSILGTGATGFIADYNQKKPHKLDAVQQVAFAKKNDINLLIASPFFIEELAKVGTDLLPSLRRILTGGAPVFPKAATLIEQRFPKSDNVIAYGSTEAEPISTISMKTLIDMHADLGRGLCVGKLHPEVSCKVIKISKEPISLETGDWTDWELAAGAMGEIVVSGPHVLDKYYNSEKAFKENKIQLGKTTWHRTGDSGILVDGVLYLHGRCSQLITIGDKQCSPFIIENQLQEIEGVAIGTLLELKGRLIVCVELTKDISSSQIERELQRKDIPCDDLQILEKIPRDPRHFSKIEYGKLKQLIKGK